MGSKFTSQFITLYARQASLSYLEINEVVFCLTQIIFRNDWNVKKFHFKVRFFKLFSVRVHLSNFIYPLYLSQGPKVLKSSFWFSIVWIFITKKWLDLNFLVLEFQSAYKFEKSNCSLIIFSANNVGIEWRRVFQTSLSIEYLLMIIMIGRL